MKIIIPTDFSINADMAFKYAIHNFPNAEYTVFHSVNVPQAGSTMVVDINEDLKKVQKRSLEKYTKEIKEKFPGLKVNPIVQIGTLVDSLNGELEDNNYDFVVMGTKGSSGIKEVLMGSNAYEAIKNLNKTILLVPEFSIIESPKNLLITSDFKGKENNKETGNYQFLKNYFKGNIHLLHIITENETAKQIKFSDRLNDIDLDVNLKKADNIEIGILNYIADNDIDLLSVIAKERGFFENLFHSSVTKKLAMHSVIPVLVFKS